MVSSYSGNISLSIIILGILGVGAQLGILASSGERLPGSAVHNGETEELIRLTETILLVPLETSLSSPASFF